MKTLKYIILRVEFTKSFWYWKISNDTWRKRRETLENWKQLNRPESVKASSVHTQSVSGGTERNTERDWSRTHEREFSWRWRNREDAHRWRGRSRRNNAGAGSVVVVVVVFSHHPTWKEGWSSAGYLQVFQCFNCSNCHSLYRCQCYLCRSIFQGQSRRIPFLSVLLLY